MPVYLGFDSSTQSLSVIAIEVEGERRQVLFERSLNFDESLPHYRTKKGLLKSDDPLVARSSPLMWAEALDVLLGIVAKESGIDLARIKAISGSGQQHGSVYLASGAGDKLGHLDAKKPLAKQLQGLFTRDASPIWMDSSTSAQCKEIADAMGGDGVLALLTGSRAVERFTGPQIRRYFQEDPDGYERTEKIHLVSSYMASLLAGKHAPIEPGDGAGMNLMDLAHRRWAATALEATAPDLEQRLPELKESWNVVGHLSPYWVKRHGFPDGVKVIAWTGDNPSSLVGVGLVKQGRMAISLGTSDTLFGFMLKPEVDLLGRGHVFGSPTGDFMSLICFKNGSLARERVCREQKLDWEGFENALRQTPPGNGGAIMLPWFEPEITPNVHDAGVRRFGLDPKDGPANVRALVEGQMMTMALHSQWMGVQVETIHATGGAAKNQETLRVMADVHHAKVDRLEVGNAACLGAALRAYHGDQVAEHRKITWEEVIAGFTEPVKESRIHPDPRHVELYAELKKVYAACEAHAIRGGEDPSALIEAFRRAHR